MLSTSVVTYAAEKMAEELLSHCFDGGGQQMTHLMALTKLSRWVGEGVNSLQEYAAGAVLRKMEEDTAFRKQIEEMTLLGVCRLVAWAVLSQMDRENYWLDTALAKEKRYLNPGSTLDTDPELAAEVDAHLLGGRVIHAIRAYRLRVGCDLMEAKEVIDARRETLKPAVPA